MKIIILFSLLLPLYFTATYADISEEGFQKLDTIQKQLNEVELMRAQILLNKGKDFEALEKINKIISTDPTYEEAFNLLFEHYNKKGDVLKKLSILEDFLFALEKKTPVENMEKEQTSKKILGYVLDLVINHLDAMRKFPAREDFHYQRGMKYLGVLKKSGFRLYSYHLYLALYQFEKRNYLASFRSFHKVKAKEVSVTEGLKNTSKFYEGLHYLKAGAIEVGLRQINQVKNVTENKKIKESAEKMHEIYMKPKFSAFFLLNRILNSNVSGLSDERRTTSALEDGGYSTQVLLGANLLNIALFDNPWFYTDPDFFFLNTRQDKKEFESYTHRYLSAGLKIRPQTSLFIIPYFKYSYSKLYLNQLNSESQYELSGFSYTQMYGLVWNIPTQFGQIEFDLVYEDTTEENNRLNDSYAYGAGFNFKVWEIDTLLNPYLKLDYTYDKFPHGGLPNEEEYSVSLGNDFKLNRLNFKIEPGYILVENQGINEKEYKLRAQAKALYNFIWKEIKGNYNITYQYERYKKNDPVTFVDRSTLKLGILIAY